MRATAKLFATPECARAMVSRLRRAAGVYRIGEIPDILADAAEMVELLDERIAIMSGEQAKEDLEQLALKLASMVPPPSIPTKIQR